MRYLTNIQMEHCSGSHWLVLSGSGKSEPLDIAMRPIYKAESALEESYLKEKAEYEEWLELSKKEKGEQRIEPKKCLRKTIHCR
ncbi:MAG: hypothetical protein IPH20_14580 [Bacteroidales bacterium]|nr:hypothetical protein [Bacteroidales bacterium]